MATQLRDVKQRWTELGGSDPMWAALTEPSKAGRWDAADFLATGTAEIESVLASLARRGVTPTRGTAVDFGCGPGRLTAGLAAAGFRRAIGIDVSPPMLEKARELVDDPRCEFVLNEGTDLSTIPTASVDFVYSCRVLQHVPQPIAHGYVREFFRIAGEGGVVVFQLPSHPAGGVGALMRLAPAGVLDRLRKGMEMHGTHPAEVTRVIADAGGVTISIEEDTSAGPRWRSHLYLCRIAG